MIRKIKTTEYLEQYGSMSYGERREYQSRVGEWLSNEGRRLLDMTERPMAKSQNIMLLSARCKKTEATTLHWAGGILCGVCAMTVVAIVRPWVLLLWIPAIAALFRWSNDQWFFWTETMVYALLITSTI